MFVTLSLVPFSPLPLSLSSVSGVAIDLLQNLTWRPNWPADLPAHLENAKQAAQSAPALTGLGVCR